jgi:hypothetical protein
MMGRQSGDQPLRTCGASSSPLPPAAIGHSHLCRVADLQACMPITLLDGLSGERHNLTNAQNPAQLQKTAGFCNTIAPKATKPLGCAK